MSNNRPIIIVKKKGGRAAHHGGAWKVAFADFITALMALFLVLWLVGQSQKAKEAVAGHFRNPPGILDGSKSGLLPGNEGVNQEIQPKEDSPISFEDEMPSLNVRPNVWNRSSVRRMLSQAFVIKSRFG